MMWRYKPHDRQRQRKALRHRFDVRAEAVRDLCVYHPREVAAIYGEQAARDAMRLITTKGI